MMHRTSPTVTGFGIEFRSKGKLLYALGELTSDSPVLGDGTLWSHAATMGTRIKGTAFTIDRSVIENFIKVFKTGYPQKICVDYEHGTLNGATDFGQPVPAAGQVLELRGVYGVGDFNGDLKATAEKLASKVNRPLDDPRNFGLWMRWRPTARALQMVTQREYTELSIAFAHNYEDNESGAEQGPTILSVALTNTPFLDDMLPVAASRRDGEDPAHAGQSQETRTMSNPTLLQRAAAFLGRPVASEEDAYSVAEDRITTLTRENDNLKKYKAVADVVESELKESDVSKMPEKIRQLNADVTKANREREEAADRAAGSEADKILLKHENRLTPAQKEYFKPQIVTELKAGAKAGETKVEKVIESFPEIKTLGRKSATDGGKDAPTDRDARIQLRANELMESDPAIKRQAEKDEYGAYKRALRRASSEIPNDDNKK